MLTDILRVTQKCGEVRSQKSFNAETAEDDVDSLFFSHQPVPAFYPQTNLAMHLTVALIALTVSGTFAAPARRPRDGYSLSQRDRDRWNVEVCVIGGRQSNVAGPR